MEFTKGEQTKIIEDLGNLSLSEMGKELGKRWQCLSKEEKGIFENRSKENRAQYVKERENYAKTKISAQENVDAPNTLEESTEEELSEAVETPIADSIVLGDLGFAKQTGFPWHPALKTDLLAKETRVKVTFFGTGQSGTVDEANWKVYSAQTEERCSTPKLKKTAVFKTGLSQLKCLREKLLNSETPVTSSGILFTPQLEERRFRRLSKDHLQKEEEENMYLMEKKMTQQEGSNIWTCKECEWKGKFRLKAKAHARDCGQRKRTHVKKSKKKKFDCSNGTCSLSFANISKLKEHYRYI